MKVRGLSNIASRTKAKLSRWHWRLVTLEDRLTPTGLLPNLQVLPSYLPTGNVAVNAAHEVRFSTGLANGGVGPFDLRANGKVINNPDGTQSILTNQRVYNDVNSNGKYDATIDTTFVDQLAGYFSYHPTHGHMHFNEFAIARLRLRPTDQSVGPTVATGPKTSFCLIDINHYNPSLPGSPASATYGCDATSEGISIGWNDVYGSGLDGQYINVTNIPNGDYWLEVECDYANHIQETNENDNIARTAITITNQPVNQGFLVLSSEPQLAQQMPVNTVDFYFNQAVDSTTFTSSVINFNGPGGTIPVTVQQISAVQMRANFATQSAIGTYTMTLAPTVRSATGKLMDQNNNGTGGEAADNYTNIFTVTAPSISIVTPAGTTGAPVSTVRVTYNREMNSSTFTSADVLTFTGPGGSNLLGTISAVTPVTPGGQSTAFDIVFTPVSNPGLYTMVIGANVADPAGNLVDQNNNGIPNEVADRYTDVFTIPIAGTYGPDAFGYTAIASTIQTISMTGATGLSFSNTDDGASLVNLGTDSFNFYGTSYTGASTVYASTNGLLSLGASNAEYTNDDLTGITTPTIAALWDDWIIGPGTPQVRYLKRDTNGDTINDQLVVEWNQVYHYQQGTTNPITFQTMLELNTGVRPGRMWYNYTDLDTGNTYTNGGSATVGIRSNATLNSRLVVSQDSNSHPLIASGKAMMISVPSVTGITRLDPNPADDGEVTFQVSFSDGVVGVDPTDFALTTTGNISGATVTGVMPTADAKVWQLLVDTHIGSGTVRLDLVDDDSIISVAGAKLGGTGLGNGNFAGGQAYTIVQQPPLVFHIGYNNDSAQRSRIDEIRVTFDHPVTFAGTPEAAFQIVGPNGPINMAVDLSISNPEQTVARLTFTGTGTEFGSLSDGNYTLTVIGSQVNTAGVLLDGDDNGTAGGNYVTTFHRLFGDFDGDRDVDSNDFSALRGVFGFVGAGNAFDFDNDGDVDTADYGQFRSRYGMVI